MLLRVQQGQGRPPGSAKQQPTVDLQIFANGFHIVYQRCGVIVVQRRMRCRSSRPSLIEQHDTVALGIEKTAVFRVAAGARAAVHEQHRDAIGIATLFQVERVGIVYRKGVGGRRLYFGVESKHHVSIDKRSRARLVKSCPPCAARFP